MGRPLAVITGASSGIGEVFARRLAVTHDLLLISRSEARLQALATELKSQHGGEVQVQPADLADLAGCQLAAARIAAQPALELLVNNAGFGDRGPFWREDIEVLERMHRLHINALVRLSHAALAVMVPKNRGALINLASVAAFARRPGSACYGASKTWVTAFTEGLYVDLRNAQSAVTVQALCPGYTYSNFHDLMHEDRTRLAPPSRWLRAEHVVDDSLRALARGQLYCVPGWRYKIAVALLRILPFSLALRVATFGSRPAPAP
jgi:uncharacterized protein